MRYTISFLLAALPALPALAEVPRVVTDIPPVHSIVAQVMGDLGVPILLLDRGADPHAFQMRPSQAADVAQADLVVWIGPEMTPWLGRAADSLAPDGRRLTLLSATGTETQAFGAKGDHDNAEEGHDDATEAAGGDHADHDDTGIDPHAWLDPHNARVWAGLIADELSTLDPANAATYAANAAAAQARIDTLDSDLTAQLGRLADQPFVVFHDAYGYFTAHYGLTVAGTIALGDAASPGAARLSDLRAGLEAGDALCIFPEAAHDPKQVVQMADGTNVRVGGVLEPEGATLEPGPGLYDSLMRGLGQTLADCLTPKA